MLIAVALIKKYNKAKSYLLFQYLMRIIIYYSLISLIHHVVITNFQSQQIIFFITILSYLILNVLGIGIGIYLIISFKFIIKRKIQFL